MVTGFLLPCGARAVRTVSSESDWHFEARSPESRLSSASPTTSGQCPLCRSSSMSRPLLVLASCLLLLGFTSVADGAEEAIKCTIPGDQPGKCIPSYECSPYEEALTYITVTNIEFLRHSQCKVEGNTALVCCPDSGNYTFTDIPKPTKRRVRPPPANSLLANRFGDNTLPSNDDCGKQAAPNRIFDGIVTGIDEFPWMALFAYKRRYADGKPVLACGGALISSRYVLTAAHCVSGEGFDKLQGIDKIRLGEYNIESDEDCVIEKDYQDCSEPVVERSAQEIIVHPDYEVASKHQYNDIALVRLDAPVLFSDFIQPICLPDTKTFNFTVKEGEVMLVAGWGRTERARNSPIKLKLGVPIVKNEHCGHSYKRFGIDVGHGQICAGGEAGKDSCKGDSGGPLMTSDGRTGNWIVSGVVSIGPNKCGQSDIPGVYTNVQDYVDWIQATVKP